LHGHRQTGGVAPANNAHLFGQERRMRGAFDMDARGVAMQLFNEDFFDDLCIRAGASARLRTHYNVHQSPRDPVQRLFIAARRRSYFRPHRHAGAWEFVLVLRGRFDLIIFDDAARVTARHTVTAGSGLAGFEVPRALWHAWMADTDAGVFFEAKPGPYDPLTAAEFAPWSPAEGSAPADDFLNMLRGLRVGDCAVRDADLRAPAGRHA
jgi:cupin fold WbuC family metalloprotein